MKKFILLFASLLILIMVVMSACVPGAVPEEKPAPPETELVAPETEPAAPEEEPPAKKPLQERSQPMVLVSSQKPALRITGLDDMDPNQVIAYVFPDGTFAIKATPVEYSRFSMASIAQETGFVGGLEIGDDAQEISPGRYYVSLDLTPRNTEGEIIADLENIDTGDIYTILFLAVPQTINPERENWFAVLDNPPPLMPSISADGVCYTAEYPTGDYVRLCSEPGSLLSIWKMFPDKFDSNIEDLRKSIEILNAGDEEIQRDVDINMDMAISEMEDPGHLYDCAMDEYPEKCAADIIGAPNQNFWDDFYRAKDSASINDFSTRSRLVNFNLSNQADAEPRFVVTGGLVRILQEITIEGYDPVLPGNYWVEFWFGEEEVFLGATITGITDAEERVVDQPIQAVPASYISADGREEVLSMISAWRISRWCCFWQSNCP